MGKSKKKMKYDKGYEASYNKIKFDMDSWVLVKKERDGYLFKMDNGRMIKIYFKKEKMEKDQKFLEKVADSKYFPNVHEIDGNCLIRDRLPGITLKKHIKKHGMNRKVVEIIVALLMEFKRLKFKTNDVKLSKVYIDDNENVKVLPMHRSYTKKMEFPEKLIKDLIKLAVIDMFMSILKEVEPSIYKEIEKYVDKQKQLQANRLYRRYDVLRRERLRSEAVVASQSDDDNYIEAKKKFYKKESSAVNCPEESMCRNNAFREVRRRY